MSISLSTAQINSAAAGNGTLRDTLLAIKSSVEILHQATGTAPVGTKVDSTAKASQLAPTPATFKVTGANGTFTVSITNPANPSKATIYHEVSSSTDPTFASGVTTYALSAATQQSIPAPGETRTFRLRSTIDQVTFTGYQVLPDAVSAGLVSSSATHPNLTLNQSNFAMVDSVANGATAKIRIYGSGGVGSSWSRKVGSNSTVIPGGTILGVAYGSNGFIAWDGAKYQLKSQLPETFPDGWVPVGAVSVIANAAGLVLPVIHAIVTSGAIVAYQIVNPGNNLGSVKLIVSDTTGTGATAVATIQNGQVVSVTGSSGTGYSASPTVNVTASVSPGQMGGGGTQGNNGGRLYTVGN